MGYDINKDKNKNRTRVVIAVIIIIILLLLWFFGYYKEKVGKNLSFNYDADAKASVEYKDINLNKSKKKKIRPRVIENEETEELEETVHELVDSLPVSRAVKKVIEKEEIVVTIRSSITQPSTIVPTKPVIKDDKEKEDKYIVNPHILAVYEYSESGDNFCISGEENTCKEIKNITPDYVYREDTIVKYEVKDGTILYFNIIKDNGDSITMQQTKNTVAGDLWSTTPQNSNGPTKILSALEDATSDWVYVKDQTYTEEEIFKNNFKTGCKIENDELVCDDSYPMITKQTPVKARMITIQEIERIINNDTQNKKNEMGNFVITKLFLLNNLFQVESLNGTEHYGKTFIGLVNDNEINPIYGPKLGYWTMSAAIDDKLTNAWMVTTPSTSAPAVTQNPTNGARAVVMVEKKEKQKYEYSNPNMISAYKYDETGSGEGKEYTGCLSGVEKGCKQISIKAGDKVEAGTIIRYKVSENESKYFNVLYDKGDKLVMQQTENTTENALWYEEADNSKGPTTAISLLENATANWTNVNPISYEMGKTQFGTGAFATKFTALPIEYGVKPLASNFSRGYSNFLRENVKARMITAQEAGEMGCVAGDSTSCLRFMNNYLSGSIGYGGSFEVGKDINNKQVWGYWTMTAKKDSSYNAIDIDYRYMDSNPTNHNKYYGFGTRAVVEINKGI